MKENKSLINDQILYPEVLVVSENGEQLGRMATNDAIKIANNKDLDLVLVSSNDKNPVCKIMDYSKYKFEQTKKQKEMKKKQKEIVVKEIQLSLNIDEHDFQTKLKNARKFIEHKNRVQVVLRLKGRERAFADKGIEVVTRFFNECQDIASLSKPIAQTNNQIMFVMMPV